MPPAKGRPTADEMRSDAANMREKPTSAAAHAKKSRNGTAAHQANGTVKEAALVGIADPAAATNGVHLQGTGMAWNTVEPELLDRYRVSHSLPTPPAFTSPLHQALLTNPGIGRQSPTMARKKDKRRTSKEQLALAVRKHFNAAAVNEIDVVVELVYKVRNQDNSFRLRSAPGVTKK